MNDGWQIVPIKEAASPVERPERPMPGTLYRQLGVRLWGVGAYEREPLEGSQTKYATLSRVAAGDIVVNKIWARNGSVAVVPDTLAGCYVSGEFPTFAPYPELLDPRWFHWITKTRGFWEQCDEKSRGTSGKNRIRPEQFLQITIPLPPLAEQQRIVGRIEELAGKIEEARGLRRAAVEEAGALWLSALDAAYCPTEIRSNENATALLAARARVYRNAPRTKYNGASPWEPRQYSNGPYHLPANWVWTDLGTVLTHIVDCVNDTPDFSDRPTGLLGLKSTNIRPYKLDLSTRWFVTQEDFNNWNRRQQPQAGDLILTREAPMGNACILPTGLDVCLTQRLMLLRCDQEFIDRRYILHFLNSSHFRRQVLDECRGLTTPHIRVQDAPQMRVPLAPLPEQRRIIAYLDDLQAKVDALKKLQAETAAELDAMLPSVLDRAFKGEL
jgi:type I restriction enzyme S subunit